MEGPVSVGLRFVLDVAIKYIQQLVTNGASKLICIIFQVFQSRRAEKHLKIEASAGTPAGQKQCSIRIRASDFTGPMQDPSPLFRRRSARNLPNSRFPAAAEGKRQFGILK
jgi:hypothetical protein